MTYESELSALTTAFFQRQQRFPNFSEKDILEEAARDTVYGTPKGCGHQLTESEFEYYENRRLRTNRNQGSELYNSPK